MLIAPDGTTFSTLARPNGTYAVQIAAILGLPDHIEGFRSYVDAEQWIYEHVAEQRSLSCMKMTIGT